MKKGDMYLCKRDNSKGTVVAFDDYTVKLKLEDNTEKLFTRSMFNKWWKETFDKPYSQLRADIKFQDIPKKLEDAFLQQLKTYGGNDIDKSYRQGRGNSRWIFRYNGFIILELKRTKYRLEVMAHQNALTPQLRGMYTILPPQQQKSLRAKFIFTSLDEIPYFKVLITDSIFYRK